jgi:hypothetical protein
VGPRGARSVGAHAPVGRVRALPEVPIYANAFLLRLSTRHHGPDEVWLEPHTVIAERDVVRYAALVMAPQIAVSLALGILGLLQEHYGTWEIVTGEEAAPTVPAAPVRLHPSRRGANLGGRPSKAEQYRATILRLKAEGWPQTVIAKECGLSESVVSVALKRWRNGHSAPGEHV